MNTIVKTTIKMLTVIIGITVTPFVSATQWFDPCTNKYLGLFDLGSNKASSIIQIEEAIEKQKDALKRSKYHLRFNIDENIAKISNDFNGQHTQLKTKISAIYSMYQASGSIKVGSSSLTGLAAREHFRIQLSRAKAYATAQTFLASKKTELQKSHETLEEQDARMTGLIHTVKSATNSSDIVETACFVINDVKSSLMDLEIDSAGDLRKKALAQAILVSNDELDDFLNTGQYPFDVKRLNARSWLGQLLDKF